MATKAPLKFLRIKEFRGSTKDFSIDFDSKKSLTLIYGENGSGKTTICDAFDFVGNQKVGSLENRGLGQLHPYWPTLGKNSSGILVELAVDGTTWKAQANAKNVSIVPANVPPPKIEVLRRSSILRLVQDAPKEKYDALRPFIDISLVELAETALRNQIKETRSTQTDAANRIAENKETLERLWKEAGSTNGTALIWAESAIGNSPSDTTADVSSLRTVVTALEALINLKGDWDTSIGEREEAETAIGVAKEALYQAEAEAMSNDAAFERILSAAKEHFDQHDVGSVCPLCESSERVMGLAQKVGDRLAKLQTLSEARQTLSTVQTTFSAKNAVVEGHQKKAKTQAATAVEKIGKAPKEWSAGNQGIIDVLSAVQTTGDLKSIDVLALRSACDAADEHCTTLENQNTWHKSVKTVYEQYQENLVRQDNVSKVLPKLDKALEICETKRKAFLDTILSAIAQNVGRLYEIIHPGEGLNKITLKLDPKKTGSLDLSTEFLSKQDQPPHAYFSESHLDSLGLCIFLALAALQDPDRTIIVMDDVLGSIDEPHVDRLIEMLYAESKNFKHTIITTHYRPWREKFRWGWLKNGQCELIELGDWNSINGIRTTDRTKSPLIELREHLAQQPQSAQAACASAGVLLEAICDYLTSLYECDAPRRKGKLTLGDLLPKINGKLKDALRVEVKQPDGSYVSIQLSGILDQLQQMAQLRNIFGCHYNDLSQHLPANDAAQFASLVHELGATLICDDEGWPGSDKSGSYWATRDETRRLHPLKKPK
ncbi:AAA family ATPase [Noviherbaspirillum sp.]|uniref:AAA family ATPase n=1 Tax=Noviherbaspirillum sp. TaxID=1926288 RepID=UPI002B477D58|nr:AAA family ATPase [Noviherbaspirillum sp.]HJV81332.1 AAA family ATPase [Noviherbaspirillum sp.]